MKFKKSGLILITLIFCTIPYCVKTGTAVPILDTDLLSDYADFENSSVITLNGSQSISFFSTNQPKYQTSLAFDVVFNVLSLPSAARLMFAFMLSYNGWNFSTSLVVVNASAWNSSLPENSGQNWTVFDNATKRASTHIIFVTPIVSGPITLFVDLLNLTRSNTVKNYVANDSTSICLNGSLITPDMIPTNYSQAFKNAATNHYFVCSMGASGGVIQIQLTKIRFDTESNTTPVVIGVSLTITVVGTFTILARRRNFIRRK